LGEKLLLFKEKNVLAKFPFCLEKTNIPRKREKKKKKKKLPKNCQFFHFLFFGHNCIMKQCIVFFGGKFWLFG
jgi:hypothetical protein